MTADKRLAIYCTAAAKAESAGHNPLPIMAKAANNGLSGFGFTFCQSVRII